MLRARSTLSTQSRAETHPAQDRTDTGGFNHTRVSSEEPIVISRITQRCRPDSPPLLYSALDSVFSTTALMASEYLSVSAAPKPGDHRCVRFLLLTLTVALLTPIVLWGLDRWSLPLYAVITFIWLAICYELFVPANPDSVWWNRVKWVRIAGWLIVGYIVFEDIASFL